jgi:hypothetical protein
MKKYFESKVRNLKKEDFTAGPMDDFAGPMDDFDEPTGMHISDAGRSSILAGDDQDETPPGPNGTRFQGSIERLVDDEDAEERERPSNEYVLVSYSMENKLFVHALFVMFLTIVVMRYPRGPYYQCSERCIFLFCWFHGGASSVCADSSFGKYVGRFRSHVGRFPHLSIQFVC